MVYALFCVQEKVTSGTPLGAILPKHATRQIVDDNGKPVSHEELFGDVEKVEQQGSGQVGATTETKTLSWWGIRKHQQPQEAENRDPDTHRHQTKRSRHERKDAERRSMSSPRRDKHSRKHR